MRIGLSLTVLVVCLLFFFASEVHDQKLGTNRITHAEWIANALKEIQTIKVGMTRRDLMKVFTTEGGLSTRTFRKYVYRGSPLIKIDVQFEGGGRGKTNQDYLDDKITSLSKPYLEFPVSD